MSFVEIIQISTNFAVLITVGLGIYTYVYSKYLDRQKNIYDYYSVKKTELTEEYWEIRQLYTNEEDKSINLEKMEMHNYKSDTVRNNVRSYLTKIEGFSQLVLLHKYNLQFLVEASGKNLVSQFYFFSEYIKKVNSYDDVISNTFYVEFYALILQVFKKRSELVIHRYYKTLMRISYFDDVLKKKYPKLYKWKIKEIKKMEKLSKE